MHASKSETIWNQLIMNLSLRTTILLILSCWIAYYYNIETDLKFFELLAITTISFIIQLFLEDRFKPILLSVACFSCLFLFLNPLNVLIFYGLGSFLFTLCVIKIPRFLKLSSIVVFGLLIIGLRSFANLTFIQPVLWPILASMFMFRIIVYLKQSENNTDKVSLLKRFNYFFLFPNVFTPLFPIVDYKLYSKAPKNVEQLYIKGVNLIALGICQLLIYRIIYTYFLPSENEVTDMLTLLNYIVFNYLLVFRLLGLFNLTVGALRVLGFDLPEIFNNIFLSTSLSDFFRRLNIYWRDFLLNTFYYPIYFKFRKKGLILALCISAVITFILNWFFHAYQWFWILGTSPIRWADTIFWGLFSIIVVFEMLRQAKYPQGVKRKSFEYLIWPIKVISTFLFIAIIWSLWTSSYLSVWINMISNGLHIDMTDGLRLIGILGMAYLLTACYKYTRDTKTLPSKLTIQPYIGFLVLFILLGTASINSIIKKVSPASADAMLSFIVPSKNIDDLEKEAEGYYNQILEFNIGSANWSIAGDSKTKSKEEVSNLKLKDVRVELNDLRLNTFLPNVDTRLKNNIHFKTNSFGLRDKEYDLAPLDSTIRIAFVGGSPEAGLNISNDSIIESITESKLNDLLLESNRNIEMLNFSLNGYSSPHYRTVTEKELFKYKPQHVLYVVRTRDFYYAFKKLHNSTIRNKKKVDAEFTDFLKAENIEVKMPMTLVKQKEFGKKIWLWSYQEIKSICIREGINPILLYIPELDIESEKYTDDYKELLEINKNNLGFDVIDLSGVYANIDRSTLRNTTNINGNHPNKKGHRIIAERLFQELSIYLGLPLRKEE